MIDRERLATAIDAHLRTLRHATTQVTAIEWMKRAYVLMEQAADDLKRPRVYSVPGHFGAPVLMLDPPTGLVLPKSQPVKPLGFFDQRVKTVVYGEKYSNTRAWTRTDTRRLERENQRKRKP